jgi:hypothetical protein
MRAGRRAGLFALTAILAITAQGSSPRAASGTAHVLAGFTFSPGAAIYAGLQPERALTQLMDALHPDLVRIPVYWSDVEPSPGTLDFSDVDRTLLLLSTQSEGSGARTRVILVVGARNVSFPELYLPAWAAGSSEAQVLELMRGPDYRAYINAVVTRYRGSPELYGWQVENEPLDGVHGGGARGLTLPQEMVRDEVDEVHSLDQAHPVVVTTFNSSMVILDQLRLSPFAGLADRLITAKASGNPGPALKLGDELGLDLYVASPNTPSDGTTIDQRIQWKEDALAYWSDRAGASGKQLWITELQGYGWVGGPDFTPAELRQSARAYAAGGATVALLWGVEDWLNSADWLRAGQYSLATLRGQKPPAGT